MKQLKVGIIGMGKMGMRRFKYSQAHPDLDVLAVCDINSDAINNFSGLRTYSDYNVLLLDNDLDIVFVCTYNNVAPEIVSEALKHGKHVFCEKPPGCSVEDVLKVIDVEHTNPGLKLKYGFNHRYHYAIMEAKYMVEIQRFGKILWMRGVYGKCGGTQFENSWRNNKQVAGGGILLDQGIHMVDLFLHFCGEFEYVESCITTSFWNIPVEDNAFAILRNKENQVALLHSSATQWKHRFVLEICLEDGYINIDGLLSPSRSYGDESITFANRQFEDESFALGRPKEETIFFNRDDSWEMEIDEFVNAIRNDTPIKLGSSKDALTVMKLIERIYEKGKDNCYDTCPNGQSEIEI
jgi:predicted dehydrogenase